MANRKAEVKKKKRTMYFEEKLFEDFSLICEKYGKSPSGLLNTYMKKIVEDYKRKSEQT